MIGDGQSFTGGLLRRGLLATPFFLIAVGLLLKAMNGDSPLFVFTLVCYSATFFLIGTILIVPIFTGFFADSFAGALFAPRGGQAHLPPYSAAESLVKKGEFNEAVDKFREIAYNFPDELRPWLEMITIAVRDLKDMDAAFEFYSEARERFQKPEDRRRLLENYKALKTLDDEKPEWLQPRKVALRPAESGESAARPREQPEPPQDGGEKAGNARSGEKAVRKSIQYRVADRDVGAPPEGYFKASEASLSSQPGPSGAAPSASATGKRTRINFSSEEIAARAAAMKQRQTEADKTADAARPSESARMKMQLNVSKHEFAAKMAERVREKGSRGTGGQGADSTRRRVKLHFDKMPPSPPPPKGERSTSSDGEDPIPK